MMHKDCAFKLRDLREQASNTTGDCSEIKVAVHSDDEASSQHRDPDTNHHYVDFNTALETTQAKQSNPIKTLALRLRKFPTERKRLLLQRACLRRHRVQVKFWQGACGQKPVITSALHLSHHQCLIVRCIVWDLIHCKGSENARFG